MTAASELPAWALDLLLAVQKHENEHADDQPCLGDALDAVPADITRYAAVIETHTRPLRERIAELEQEQEGAGTTAKRKRLPHYVRIELNMRYGVISWTALCVGVGDCEGWEQPRYKTEDEARDALQQHLDEFHAPEAAPPLESDPHVETLARVKALAQDWEFHSGRRDARRELLTALDTPREQS
ncbi:hypothetical protein [Streptomyces olivaceiscleroticus]|uniref:Uncharacterized protein n=1 Tax=Streptomyces olivaceiscleroticus TaxID=68245 RepID=A0ABN1BPC3_9ACTN